ncbi:cytochrome c oxidase assembly factor [Perkinsela sp. CCAP 1560/4]|nr:cytochrome c oxidase assembly factor [Perkinsela sp. CCAP 1560/4]|eukprot:KNH09424.1 cytochrome c oxidase assembly factor [Perkinsela sp. CCAP 1560/4]
MFRWKIERKCPLHQCILIRKALFVNSVSRLSARGTMTTDIKWSGRRFSWRKFSSKVDQTSMKKSEEVELQKDREYVAMYGKYAFATVTLLLTVYFANKWAAKKYGTQDTGAEISVRRRGRPSLGGPFVLVDTEGNVRSQKDFLGSWTIFYFGFVNCPEICPIELNRMSNVVDGIRQRIPGTPISPLFVSCDPQRDSLSLIKEYVKDFHPDFVGLVGTPDMVDRVCKSYRIYYSTPGDDVKDSDDYLIDHSIAVYVFDPQGRFVDFFGTRYTEQEILDKLEDYVYNYNADPTWTTW